MDEQQPNSTTEEVTDLGTETPSSETPTSETSNKEPSTELTPSSDNASDESDLGTTEGEGEQTEEKKAEEDPYKDFRGPPETDYEDFILPDGAEASPALREAFAPLAKELGLSQAGAQKLVDFKLELDKNATQIWNDHVASLKEAAKADPEIGKAKYTESINLGRGVIAKFGSPALPKVLTQYGLAAHPEMVRFLRNIGKAVGETLPVDNGGNGASGSKPLHERMYPSEGGK